MQQTVQNLASILLGRKDNETISNETNEGIVISSLGDNKYKIKIGTNTIDATAGATVKCLEGDRILYTTIGGKNYIISVLPEEKLIKEESCFFVETGNKTPAKFRKIQKNIFNKPFSMVKFSYNFNKETFSKNNSIIIKLLVEKKNQTSSRHLDLYIRADEIGGNLDYLNENFIQEKIFQITLQDDEIIREVASIHKKYKDNEQRIDNISDKSCISFGYLNSDFNERIFKFEKENSIYSLYWLEIENGKPIYIDSVKKIPDQYSLITEKIIIDPDSLNNSYSITNHTEDIEDIRKKINEYSTNIEIIERKKENELKTKNLDISKYLSELDTAYSNIESVNKKLSRTMETKDKLTNNAQWVSIINKDTEEILFSSNKVYSKSGNQLSFLIDDPDYKKDGYLLYKKKNEKAEEYKIISTTLGAEDRSIRFFISNQTNFEKLTIYKKKETSVYNTDLANLSFGKYSVCLCRELNENIRNYLSDCNNSDKIECLEIKFNEEFEKDEIIIPYKLNSDLKNTELLSRFVFQYNYKNSSSVRRGISFKVDTDEEKKEVDFVLKEISKVSENGFNFKYIYEARDDYEGEKKSLLEYYLKKPTISASFYGSGLGKYIPKNKDRVLKNSPYTQAEFNKRKKYVTVIDDINIGRSSDTFQDAYEHMIKKEKNNMKEFKNELKNAAASIREEDNTSENGYQRGNVIPILNQITSTVVLEIDSMIMRFVAFGNNEIEGYLGNSGIEKSKYELKIEAKKDGSKREIIPYYDKGTDNIIPLNLKDYNLLLYYDYFDIYNWIESYIKTGNIPTPNKEKDSDAKIEFLNKWKDLHDNESANAQERKNTALKYWKVVKSLLRSSSFQTFYFTPIEELITTIYNNYNTSLDNIINDAQTESLYVQTDLICNALNTSAKIENDNIIVEIKKNTSEIFPNDIELNFQIIKLQLSGKSRTTGEDLIKTIYIPFGININTDDDGKNIFVINDIESYIWRNEGSKINTVIPRFVQQAEKPFGDSFNATYYIKLREYNAANKQYENKYGRWRIAFEDFDDYMRNIVNLTWDENLSLYKFSFGKVKLQKEVIGCFIAVENGEKDYVFQNNGEVKKEKIKYLQPFILIPKIEEEKEDK